MRVMAIDYGDARSGVALSDPSGLLTGFTTVIHSRNRENGAGAAGGTVQEERGADRLVMGFPRNMDGTEGPRAALYREFAASLEESGAEARLSAFGMSAWTTVEAHQILFMRELPRQAEEHRRRRGRQPDPGGVPGLPPQSPGEV